MTDFVIVDGIEYPQPKEVSSVAIVPTIKITWNDGSVVYLSGITYSITFSTATRWANYGIFGYGAWYRYSSLVGENEVVFGQYISTYVAGYTGQPSYVGKTYDAYWICSSGNTNYSPSRRIRHFSLGGVWDYSFISYSSSPVYPVLNDEDDYGISLIPDDNTPGVFPKRCTVTTTSGSSFRIQDNPPTISNICAIAVTFTDNTTSNIYLNSCPNSVKIRHGDQCPDGTFKVCEDGITICCYECNGIGGAVLAHTFNRS